jgi:ubiquinone/menaquinone biosynthesis C-methylase UbiE
VTRSEADRIREEYARRDREIGRAFYSLTRPANLFVRHGQERALLTALVRANALPLADRRILDVGCGLGGWLAVLEDFGAVRAQLSGIDLDETRLAETRQRFQGADLRVGDGAHLPWPDGSFDLVLQSTVFTSILDAGVRASVAAEMRRVLVPRGVIVWYDFLYNNPSNPNVRGIGSAEIRALFPACQVKLERVTLAPPISRRLVPLSWLAAAALERLRMLNTHYLGVITPD